MHNKSVHTWCINCPVSAQIRAGFDYTPSLQISVLTCYSNNFESNTVTFKNVFFTPKNYAYNQLYRVRTFMNQLANFCMKCYEDLPPLSDDVAPLPVGSTSGLFPFMAPTLNSPSFPSFTASLSVMITFCSFVVELNVSPRSTMILPHLGTDINWGLEWHEMENR